MAKWIVTSPQRGTSLGQFLRLHLDPSYSGKEIRRYLDKGRCRVNGVVQSHASYLLVTGETVEWEEATLSLDSEEFLEFLLIKDDFVIVDKKPCMTTDGPGGLFERVKKSYPNAQMVHRLDRETSGAILFALGEEARLRFESLFFTRAMEKEYVAIVCGCPKESSGRIENYLGPRHKRGNFAVWGEVPKDKGGVLATTDWEVLAQGKEAALVRCYPETGRTHQIRVHLAGLGCPIIGDRRYFGNRRSPYFASRCLLHAHRLTFTDPLNGSKVSVAAPIPKEMVEAMGVLHLHDNNIDS